MTQPETEARRALMAHHPRCNLEGANHTHNGPCPSEAHHLVLAVEREARLAALDEVAALVRTRVTLDRAIRELREGAA